MESYVFSCQGCLKSWEVIIIKYILGPFKIKSNNNNDNNGPWSYIQQSFIKYNNPL